MKIFNWVHRRFNNIKAENARKNGVIADHDEQQSMVENNTCAFECWRGGILSIGTFGYDPLKDEKEVCFYEEESDNEQLSEEYESDDVLISSSTDSEEEEVNCLVYGQELKRLLMEGKKRVAVDEEYEFEYVMLEKTTKKARTTLADLFSADTRDEELQKEKQKRQPINKGSETLTKEKANCKVQQGFSFGKKLIVDDARPIHKLHQLMRRMLKRKVHPDDYASLLPPQGQGEDAINDA